jgi:NADH-quinone oxidoreductase subunit F
MAAASFGTSPGLQNIRAPGWTSDIDCYLRDGGYEQLKQALTLSRDDIVNKVKNSGLRGRGGRDSPAA